MKLFPRIPFERVVWPTSLFLGGTFFCTLTLVPLYIYMHGVSWFIAGLTLFYIVATGLSITLGYHRLFAHKSFEAKSPVKWFVLLFGAAAWENSVLDWCSDHRNHHRHVDHDDDPYNINEGFWWAHIGWMLFKLRPEPPMDNVKDLAKDPAIAWQHKYIHWIAFVVGLVFPTVLAGLITGTWIGAAGGLLLAGVFRTVVVQHATFFINSACHYLGNQPYSSEHSARDSWIMALFTFGEGYHNYHHEFQYDYRNGVKPWHFDPTKWCIWLLSKFGLTYNLRTVSEARILLAEMTETRKRLNRRIERKLNRKGLHLPGPMRERWKHSVEAVHQAQEELATHCYGLQKDIKDRMDTSRARIEAWRREFEATLHRVETAMQALPASA